MKNDINKTAMQKLIINLETMGITLPEGIKKIFLSIEKDQIIEAYNKGITDNEPMNGKQYYNQKYNK